MLTFKRFLTLQILQNMGPELKRLLYLLTFSLVATGVGCKKDPPKLIPTLTTTVSNITSTTATATGNVVDDGGADITTRGFCWNTLPDPTTINQKTTNVTGANTFISTITGLIPGTLYYVRSYAVNSVGTGYGNTVTVTTPAVTATITTSALTAISATTATCGGNILNDGGALITARGVCWDVNQNPTILNSQSVMTDSEAIQLNAKTSDGTGTGMFTSSITGLIPGSKYYFRAYATNIVGTSYGNQIVGTTNAVIPTLTTTTASNITESSFTTGGAITFDGGSAVSARGVCWNTAQNPTVADNKTSEGIGPSSFLSVVYELNHNTTYYVRAYATNSMGTAYGNQIIIKTLLNPWHPLSPLKINELTWAPVNAGYDENHKYGLLFQWGRKYGQGYNSAETQGLTTIFGSVANSTGNDLNNSNIFYSNSSSPYDWCFPQLAFWDLTMYNPCPNGWRVPTNTELEALFNLGSTWVPMGGNENLPGVWVGTDHQTSRLKSIFFPAVGYRSYYSNGSVSLVLTRGSYWSATPYGSTYTYGVIFNSVEVTYSTYSRANGFSVRCVRN